MSAQTKTEGRAAEIGPFRQRVRRLVLGLGTRQAREAGLAFAAAGLALAAAAAVLRLWRADLRVPLDGQAETKYYLMLVKNLVARGDYYENSSLGAPLGQEVHDLAIGADGLNALILRALGLLASDPVLVANLFILLTFPLTALAMVLVLRRLGISPGPALVGAVLFALLPYHFHRFGHVFLTAYYAVPIAGYLFLAILTGRTLFARRVGPGRRIGAWASSRTLLTAGLCVIVGASGLYYGAFALLLLGVATLLALALRLGRSAVAAGACTTALVASVLALTLAPTLLYQLDHGVNRSVLRAPQETEEFSLKISELVLPTDGHRIAKLAAWKDRYWQSSLVQSERGQALGLLATIGFAWLWVVVLLEVLRRSQVDDLTRYSAAAVVVSVLAATTGGLSTVFAYAVSPQLHAWNRISVFIAFFSLLAVTLLLDRLRASFRGLPQMAFAAILAAALGLGILDQTSDRFIPPYEELAREHAADESFFAEVEQRVPPEASVFQLPYVPFPEANVHRPREDYDPLRGYLHTSSLRWSYGAMKGRAADWAGDIGTKPLELVLPAVAAVGFRGLELDGLGYPDGGRAVRAKAAILTGSVPLLSPDGRYAFFELNDYRRRLERRLPPTALGALRRAALEPLHIEIGRGFYRQEQEAQHSWHWAGPVAELRLVNPTDVVRHGVLETRVERAPEAADIAIRLPDGSTRGHKAVPGGNPLRLVLALQPGANVVRLSTAAPPLVAPLDNRVLHFRLVDTSLVERRLLEAADAAA